MSQIEEFENYKRDVERWQQVLSNEEQYTISENNKGFFTISKQFVYIQIAFLYCNIGQFNLDQCNIELTEQYADMAYRVLMKAYHSSNVPCYSYNKTQMPNLMMGFEFLESDIILLKARICYKTESYDAAYSLGQIALMRCEHLEEPNWRQLQNPEDSEEELEWADDKMPLSLAVILEFMAKVCRKKHKYDEALEYLISAYNIVKNIDAKGFHCWIEDYEKEIADIEREMQYTS